MLASLAEAGDSMVCGKPSIRDVLKKDTKDVNSQVWASVAKTADEAVTKLAADVAQKNQELLDLEAERDRKAGQAAPAELDSAAVKSLISGAFGGDANFADAAEAASTDCGYGMDIPYEQMDHFANAFYTAVDKFTAAAEPALKGAGKMIVKTNFLATCGEVLPGDMCAGLCEEFSYAVAAANAVGGVAMGSPTHAELVVMCRDKREEVKQLTNTLTECQESVKEIKKLREQFIKNDEIVTDSSRKVGTTTRRLKMKENMLRVVTRQFHKAVEEDKKARAALAEALEQEEAARLNKVDAENTLRMWEEHMAALLKAIEAQKIVVRQTEEALRAAEHASRVVVEFKDKLSTALTALVAYYDEAVRQPLRVMGIQEEVAIASLFPDTSSTQAAQNLAAGVSKTQEFCTTKGATLSAPAVAGIEAEGAKLTALCTSQDWSAVSGEVEAAVNKRKTRAIANLENAQKKVVSYTGVTASKDDGEVEGVWKAVAIYGDTDFAKNYLSGWKFDGTSAAKGSNAGFMIELARALNTARENAAKLWEQAKKDLAALEEEKAQVEEILVVARQYLEEMIAEYEKAVKNREEKQELARKAKEALDIVTARKVQLETDVAKLTADKQALDEAVKEANANLKKTHDTALGYFMELLHASEGTESWD